MQRITFTAASGQQIKIEKRPYYLLSIQGAGGVQTDIQTQKAMQQDGATFIDALLEPRPLILELAIMGSSRGEVHQHRHKLARVFNPKLGPGALRYEYDGGVREIRAVAEYAPEFPTGLENQAPGYQKAILSLLCPDPFWRDTATTKAEVAIWRGAFEFPLEIVPEGIEMGFREPSLIVNINNPGDVHCGMRIRFKARATVENPSLFNVNTREELKINKALEAGEILTVTTHFADKRVVSEKQGVTESAFQWLDLSSTFLQLRPGDNLFRYDADEGLDNLEVDIYFTPRYVGV